MNPILIYPQNQRQATMFKQIAGNVNANIVWLSVKQTDDIKSKILTDKQIKKIYTKNVRK